MDAKFTKLLIYSIVACLLLITIAKSYYYISIYGGCDLRARIVNTRLLFTDKSPYFNKWSPAVSDYYLDPNDNNNRIVNGNVVTPAVMYVLYPLAKFTYSKIRLLWGLLEILFGLATIVLVFKRMTLSAASPLALIVLGVVCSDTLLAEIERGQMYLFYTFFFSLIYYIYTSRWKYNEFVSGILGGFFILFRPFAAVIGVAFFINRKTKWLMGCFLGFSLGCIMFVLPRPNLWTDYSKAMKEYSNIYADTSSTTLLTTTTTETSLIENMTNLKNIKILSIGCINTVDQYLKRMNININEAQAIGLFLLTTIILSFLFLRINKEVLTDDRIFLFAFLLLFLAEIFTIAPRSAYNVIQWILPIAIIVKNGKIKESLLIILLTGLLLLHSFPIIFPHQTEIAELIFLFVISSCIFIPKILNEAIKWE